MLRSCAKEVTVVDKVTQYYPLFGLRANVVLIFSGQYVLLPGINLWGMLLKYLMSAAVRIPRWRR